MKYLFRLFSIVMVCLLTLFIFSCGSDDESEPANYSPTVDSFIVPSEFNPGDVLEFSVIAYDKDGDTLSYTWEVDIGKLSTTTGTKVEWTAPEDVDVDVESVKVTVYVSDGVSKTTKRVKRIPNEKFIPPDPPVVIVDNTPDPPLNLIVPGRGAFGIKLGDPFTKVVKIHGKQDNPIGRNRLFTYWNPDLGFAGIIDGIDLVEYLYLDHPNKAKTAGGNGVRTTLVNLEKEYGKAEEIDIDNFGGIRYWYWQRGIEFTFDGNERTKSVFIFKPIDIGPDGQIRPQQPIRNEANKLERIRSVHSTHSRN